MDDVSNTMLGKLTDIFPHAATDRLIQIINTYKNTDTLDTEELLFEQCVQHLLQSGTTCAQCGKSTTLRCSQCKQTRYCGVVCQRKHWKNGHKQACLSHISVGTVDVEDNLKTLFRSGIYTRKHLSKNSSQENLIIQQPHVNSSEGLTDNIHKRGDSNVGVSIEESDSSSGTLNLNDESSIIKSDSALLVVEESSSDSLHLDSDLSDEGRSSGAVNSTCIQVNLINETDGFKSLQIDGFKSLQSDGFKSLQSDGFKSLQTDAFKSLQSDGFKTLHTSSSTAKTVDQPMHSNSVSVKSDTDSWFETEKETDLTEQVTQVMSIFPDANERWVTNRLKIEKLSHPDSYLNCVCDILIENGPKFTETTGENAHAGKKTFPSTHLQEKKKNSPIGVSMIEKVKNSQRYVNVLSAEAEEENAKMRIRHSDDVSLLMEHSSPKKPRLETNMQVDSPNSVISERKCEKQFEEPVISPSKPDDTETFNDLSLSHFQCNSCLSYKECDELTQCCEGHVMCQQCIEPDVKGILASDKKAQINCPVYLCESTIPVGEAKKILPSIVIELLQTKLDKECMEAINNMSDIFKCPDCGLAVAMDPGNKEFQCQNEDCMLTCCRYCKKNWNDGDHVNCNSILSAADDLSSMEQFPQHWDPMPEKDTDFISVDLVPGCQEYNTIIMRYNETMPGQRVKSIRRIQNPRLWQKYLLTRKHMLDDIGAQKLNEQLLFHGANPQTVYAICKEGFDWRLCGQHGTAFGQGTYFAKNAVYSSPYCNDLAFGRHTVFPHQDNQRPQTINVFPLPAAQGKPQTMTAFPFPATQQWDTVSAFPLTSKNRNRKSKFILCARVLCGRVTKGHNGMRRPPCDTTDSKQRPFNSAVNDTNRPSIFVIFESSQTYPEYVLEFT